MTRVIRTGDILPTTGLVDYLAAGEIVYPEDRIPCKIGYLEDVTPDGEDILRAAYVFVKGGVTDKGTCYPKTTYNLKSSSLLTVLDEEV